MGRNRNSGSKPDREQTRPGRGGRIIKDDIPGLLAKGLTKKDIAKHFSVSPAAVTYAVQALERGRPPDSFMRLDPQKQNFVLQKISGENSADAARAAYSPSTDESARSIGYRCMSDPDIQFALKDLMFQEGIGRRTRIRHLRQMIESRDMTAKGKGLDMSFKIGQEYAATEINVTVDYNPQKQRERLGELRRMITIVNEMPDDADFTYEAVEQQAKIDIQNENEMEGEKKDE
jgi:hypothetical protein